MGALARTKLSTRMQLLVGLTLIGLLVLCVTALFQLKETMLDDRKEKVHNIVEIGLGILEPQPAPGGLVAQNDEVGVRSCGVAGHEGIKREAGAGFNPEGGILGS